VVNNNGYHLVMTNIAMDNGINNGPNRNRWFTGLPFLKMVDLSMAMLNNQMIYLSPEDE